LLDEDAKTANNPTIDTLRVIRFVWVNIVLSGALSRLALLAKDANRRIYPKLQFSASD
jgi:hypothetical protein